MRREQRNDPTLKGKPVAVGYPAKRGVVAAASYEARGFGVRSAMPSTVAIRKCAELVFVPPRFDVYREVSKQVQGIFKEYPFGGRRPRKSGRASTTKSGSQPRPEFPATSFSPKSHRTIANQTASSRSCRTKLRPSSRRFRSQSSIAWVRRRRPRCTRLALRQARICEAKPAFLQERFGKAGNWYFEIARGQDDRPVQPENPRGRTQPSRRI
jgi:DNA polymerase-4